MRRDGSRVTRRGIQIAPAVADVCSGLIQLALGGGQASLLTGAPGSARGVTPTPAEGLWSR
jgi:hypothetical protein